MLEDMLSQIDRQRRSKMIDEAVDMATGDYHEPVRYLSNRPCVNKITGCQQFLFVITIFSIYFCPASIVSCCCAMGGLFNTNT